MYVGMDIYLINELATVSVALLQNVLPQSGISSMNQVASLVLEHGVFVCDVDQLIVTLSLLVTNEGEVRISLLAVLANEARIVVLSGSKEG
jgi:hypothetical protein